MEHQKEEARREEEARKESEHCWGQAHHIEVKCRKEVAGEHSQEGLTPSHQKVVDCCHNESKGGHCSKEEQQRGREQKLTISIPPTTCLVTPQKRVHFFYKVFLIKQLIYIIILGS